MIGQIVFRMIVNSSLILLSSLVLAVLLIYGIKKKLLSKGLIVLTSIMATIGFLYLVTIFSVFFYEVKNEVYVEYIGDYEHSYMPEYSLLGANGYRVVLLDENNYKVCSPDNNYKDGIYNGRVVYTKWSKWVIYMDGEMKE